jgi:hypothetical protein
MPGTSQAPRYVVTVQEYDPGLIRKQKTDAAREQERRRLNSEKGIAPPEDPIPEVGNVLCELTAPTEPGNWQLVSFSPAHGNAQPVAGNQHLYCVWRDVG